MPPISSDMRPQSWTRVPSLTRTAVGNVLETYRQRPLPILPSVEPTLLPTDLGGAQEEALAVQPRQTAAASEGHLRIAHCECGAQLAGQYNAELFDAVTLHIAHHQS